MNPTLLAFIIMVLSLCACGEERDNPFGSIKGKVTDAETNFAVVEANVRILELPDKRTTTDKNGEYLLYDVPEGTYNVSIHHPRYESSGLLIKIWADKIADGSNQLSKLSNE